MDQSEHKPKTAVFIDGFNFYYGALRNSPYKWLDPSALCKLLLPNHEITSIKYFTALVSARPGDLDQPVRQQTYIRALETIPNLEVIYGYFLTHQVSMYRADGQGYVSVLKTEEKGSDVNIASHLINDGHKEAYEGAVLITNDSDLTEPVRIVTQELSLPVGVLNPYSRRASRSLTKYASFVKSIRKGVLSLSQFPDELKDSVGDFHKPQRW